MYNTVLENLYATAIGREMLHYLKDRGPDFWAERVESEAAALLGEIKAILDDPTLDDPECFQRIDGIVSAFHRAGLPTTRHQGAE